MYPLARRRFPPADRLVFDTDPQLAAHARVALLQASSPLETACSADPE
jgi:hypothetical protein